MAATTPRGISLYRAILRAHQRVLPAELRQLGTTYVRSEFRAFRKVTNQDHLTAFFTEWDKYLDQLNVTARARESLQQEGDGEEGTGGGRSPVFAFGSDLPADVDLTKEQLEQLEKLKEETEKLGRS